MNFRKLQLVFHLFGASHEAKGTKCEEHLHGAKDHKRTHEATCNDSAVQRKPDKKVKEENKVSPAS